MVIRAGRILVLPLLAALLLVACEHQAPLDLKALDARARTGDQAAIQQLVGLLGRQDNQLSDRVYPLVVALGSSAREALRSQITSKDPIQREYSIAALGTLQATDAVPALGAVLADRSLSRRYVAAWALGEIDSPAGVPFLIKSLDDPEMDVRRYATRSLIKLNRHSVPALLAYLPTASDRGAAGAIRALGDIGDPSAVPLLLAATNGPNRQEAFLALGKLKDPRAEAALIAGLQDPAWRTRMNAAMALGPLGGPKADAALRPVLDDPEPVVREWAARSLEMISGQHMRYRNAKGKMVLPYNIYH